jgi:hypothetical protein
MHGISPQAFARGLSGVVYVTTPAGRRVRVGRLGAWHVVMSPTTKQPTLFAEGAPHLIWQRYAPDRVVAYLVSSPPKARIGRPKPAPNPPMELTGKPTTWAAGTIIVSEGSIVYV